MENHKKRTILVPIELSEHAFYSVINAVEFASAFNVKPVFAHFYLLPMSEVLTDVTLYEMFNTNTKTRLTNELKSVIESLPFSVKKALDEIEYEVIVEQGLPVDGIIKTLERDTYWMILSGTNGARGWNKIVGSLTADLMEETGVPVMAYPRTSFPNWRFKNMAIAIREIEGMDALKFCCDLADTSNAKLIGFHVGSDQSYAELVNQLDPDDRSLDKVDIKVIPGVGFEKVIEDLACEMELDMLATVIHERDIWSRFKDPSKTKKLASQMNIPVLSLPEKWKYKEEISNHTGSHELG